MRPASLFSVEGKIAVVTGASSGLGQGAASLLAAQGARVVAIGPNKRQAKPPFWRLICPIVLVWPMWQHKRPSRLVRPIF